MTEMYKRLTISDLIDLSNKTLEENHRKQFIDIAIRGWGEKVSVVKTTCIWEYNDEGYDAYLDSFKVFDGSLTELYPDFKLPFWDELIELCLKHQIGYTAQNLQDIRTEIIGRSEYFYYIKAYYNLPTSEGKWYREPSIFNEVAFFIPIYHEGD